MIKHYAKFGRLYSALFLTVLILIRTALVHAGPRVGNAPVGSGGGTWICQDKASKDYRWIEQIDLFEAKYEFGHTLAKLETGPDNKPLDEWQLLELKLTYVRQFLPLLQNLFTLTPSELRSRTHFLPDLKALTLINDGNIRVRPAPESCLDGYLYYGQLANFTDDGRLLINSVYWNRAELGTLGRTALLMHELIYKALRDHFHEGNSSRTRRLVGILFSDLSAFEMQTQIEQVLMTPAPRNNEAEVSLDATKLVCKAELTAAGPKDDYQVTMFSQPFLRSQKLAIGHFNYELQMDLATGLPTLLTLTDETLDVKTSLDKATLQTVLLQKGLVGVTLDRKLTGESALLSCELKPRTD